MPAISLTLNEAGYVVGQPSTAINRAIDRGVIKARLQRQGNARLRKLGPAELRYLAIAGEVEKDLTPAARQKIYQAMRRLPANARRLVLGVMEFKLVDIDRRIAQQLRRLESVKALVDQRSHENPIIRGANVPVYVVAALARGQTTVEIIKDYPGLTPEQVEAAVDYAKVYPKPGRPLPVRSFKRALADMAESGVWDVQDGRRSVRPHPMP